MPKLSLAWSALESQFSMLRTNQWWTNGFLHFPKTSTLQHWKQPLLPGTEDSRKVEFEVELPGVDPRRIFSLLICESQAQLDNFQKINITPKKLILIVNGTAEFTNGPYNNPRKLRVLEKKRNSYPTFWQDCTQFHTCRSQYCNLWVLLLKTLIFHPISYSSMDFKPLQVRTKRKPTSCVSRLHSFTSHR